MANEWIEVRIRSSVDSGELVALLSDPAVQGAWQEPDLIHLYWPVERWNPDVLQDLRTVLKELGEREPEGRITIDRLPDRDWNQVWAGSVQPIRIGRRVVIRPSWRRADLRSGDVELVIDPKQAFGTGHHATTQMLIEWLEHVIRGGESVLDVGTGSGILAMAALRLGAGRALGIDTDPVAVDCARGYAKDNGFGDELALRCGALTGEQAYDLVLANLDRQTLLDSADRLARCTGSRLLVSGLLTDQREEIVAAFAAAGLYPGRQREQEGWVAMEFAPAQSCEGV